MAFNDAPIVDPASKASENSVLAVKGFFKRANGFISRDEQPDYGCDLDIELITQGQNAWSKKFPIQIKSDSNVKFVEIEREFFVSKSMETSRIGYLCNRAPAYGLIIVYNEKENICYYDYVEEIVNRIAVERQNDDWKTQDSISIHIPTKNILNDSTLSEIHARFVARHQAHDLLLIKHGKEFNIPAFANPTIPVDESIDIDNVAVGDLIKKYGLMFINSFDISIVRRMLERVSLAETLQSKELIYISAVVYGEIGMCIEAELFLSKAFLRINEYEEHEQEILTFIKIKTDFLLGKRTRADYFQDLRNMTAVTKNPFNELQLKINILYYEIIQRIESSEFTQGIETEILETFVLIEKAGIDEEQRYLLTVFHAENLNMYITSAMLQYVNRIRFRESLMINVTQKERWEVFIKCNTLITLSSKKTLEALIYAKKNDKKLVKAHAEYALARFHFTKHYDMMLLNFKDTETELETNMRRSLLFAVDACNVFMEIDLVKDARLSLICAFDLIRIAKLNYDLDITSASISEDIVLNNLKACERQMGLQKNYESIVDKAFQGMQKENNKDDDEFWKTVDDAGLQMYAKKVLKEYNLPIDRLDNIVNEMKGHKYFVQHVNKKDYELLVDLEHFLSPVTTYAYPISFIIRKKESGIQSKSSDDLKSLVEQFIPSSDIK